MKAVDEFSCGIHTQYYAKRQTHKACHLGSLRKMKTASSNIYLRIHLLEHDHGDDTASRIVVDNYLPLPLQHLIVVIHDQQTAQRGKCDVRHAGQTCSERLEYRHYK